MQRVRSDLTLNAYLCDGSGESFAYRQASSRFFLYSFIETGAWRGGFKRSSLRDVERCEINEMADVKMDYKTPIFRSSCAAAPSILDSGEWKIIHHVDNKRCTIICDTDVAYLFVQWKS